MDWQATLRDVVTFLLFPMVIFMGKLVLDMMKVQAAQKQRNEMIDKELAERNRTIDHQFIARALEVDREFEQQNRILKDHESLFKQTERKLTRVDKNLACVCVKLDIKCETDGD